MTSLLPFIRSRFAQRAVQLGLAAGLVVGPQARAFAIGVQDVITLAGLEVPDEQIIKKIQKDGSVFKLAPSEILELKKKGVSDKVIKFMLQTSQGGAAAAASSKKTEDKPKRELSAAEQAADEARLKEEALRLAEEERKRQGASQKAFANQVMARGLRYAEDGDWVKSIQLFEKFVSDGANGVPYAPDSDEAYNASYGVAKALVNAGLWQSGASKLLDVVRGGPDKTFFRDAFTKLRELRRKINYRPPELEDLTKFNVVSQPAEFQDGYNYFVGEFLHDFGLSNEAKPYLDKVHANAEDYARAQYLMGLIAFEDETSDKKTQITDASQAFQKAVLSAEKQGNNGLPVVDLSYLALARLAYEFEQFDAAIYYYKKISRNSPKLASAFYESGWAYFLKNDTSRALGTFEALHSPYFAHHFYPELWVLEATIYVNLCRYDEAEAAVKMFKDHILVLGPPLRDFIKKNRKPEEYYASFVESVNKKSAAGLPRVLQSPVLENVEFYNIYQTIKQIEREEATVKQQLNALGGFGQELLSRLGQLRQERVSEAGVVIQKTLRTVVKDLDLYTDKLDQLQIDVMTARQDKIDQQIAAGGDEEKAGQVVERSGSVAIAGSDVMIWPFEGEFWKDEIGAYRSFLKTQCPVEK